MIRLALLLLVGFVLVVWAVREQFQADLSVQNRSGQAIAVLTLTVAGQPSTFQNVPDGADVLAPRSPAANEPFSVDGRLADGTLIRGRFAGAGGRMVLAITPGGQIVLRPPGKG
jgi:hypothetical protein